MNGKGDKDRTSDRERYRAGYDAINWGRQYIMKTVYAAKPMKPDQLVVIRHRDEQDV